VQGPLFYWVARHRLHHHHSDQEGDPHSPHHHGSGLRGGLRGFWHAHLGWLFQADAPNLYFYVKDLHQSRLLHWVNFLFPFCAILGLLIPALLGWLMLGGWTGALLGLVWGGLVRICLSHHVTWSVNSVCHLWGTRPFPTRDQSRNNCLVGILAMGEGWHNNHHAFPTSARHGLRWWQFDMCYVFIRILVLLGLAWNMKLPPTRMVAA
jgi:stearoyl-CoA desaturase (delta-9 desaturase)